MKVTLESTTKTVTVNGVPARVWEGQTASGIRVHAFITRIATEACGDQTEFQRELAECREPSAEVKAYPLRLFL